MKIPRWIAVLTAVSLLAVVALATSALTYRVQSGDTLSALAWRYGTSVGAIATANHIANPDLIYAGQTLEIPAGEVYAAQQGNTTIPAVPVYQPAPAQHTITTYPAVVAASPQLLRSGGTACARFNFEAGRDGATGSRQAGTYIMRQTTGEDLASWFARTGDKDSGWLHGIALSFEAVHVTVTFYPANGGAAIPMQIVNHAPDTSAGWLARDMCHAIEIQFP